MIPTGRFSLPSCPGKEPRHVFSSENDLLFKAIFAKAQKDTPVKAIT